MPVIGFLDARAPDAMADRLRGLRQGLGEAGYVEGDNVAILYRWGRIRSIDRPNWRPSWFAGGSRPSLGVEVSPQLWLQEQRPRQSPSYSSSPKTCAARPGQESRAARG